MPTSDIAAWGLTRRPHFLDVTACNQDISKPLRTNREAPCVYTISGTAPSQPSVSAWGQTLCAASWYHPFAPAQHVFVYGDS